MSRYRRPRLVLVLAALLVLPGGCGLFFDGEAREPWRAQAEAACLARKEVAIGPQATLIRAIDGPGICGIDRPLRIGGAGGVTVTPSATLGCPMTAALERWVAGVVQPAAVERYGVPVVSLRNAASYGCRTRNHRRSAPLSEHAFANALDIAAFTLADGRTVTVAGGWRGEAADRAFLRQVLAGACGRFATVLGPGSDGMHEDHFHFDLARRASGNAYCRPEPATIAPPPAPTPAPAAAPPAPVLEVRAPAAPVSPPTAAAAPPIDPAEAYPGTVGAPPLVWRPGPMPPAPDVTGSLR